MSSVKPQPHPTTRAVVLVVLVVLVVRVVRVVLVVRVVGELVQVVEGPPAVRGQGVNDAETRGT